jgi:hypothetical protein
VRSCSPFSGSYETFLRLFSLHQNQHCTSEAMLSHTCSAASYRSLPRLQARFGLGQCHLLSRPSTTQHRGIRTATPVHMSVLGFLSGIFNRGEKTEVGGVHARLPECIAQEK